jgi:hypothetical protein
MGFVTMLNRRLSVAGEGNGKSLVPIGRSFTALRSEWGVTFTQCRTECKANIVTQRTSIANHSAITNK